MTNSSLIVWPGYQLAVDTEIIRIDSNEPEPNPAWRFVDAEGHGHFYDDGYPTLRWVSLPCTMGHGDECDAEGYYECPLCQQRITPDTRTPMPTSIPGLVTYALTVCEGEMTTVYVFGQDELDALQAAIGVTVCEVLADCVAERR